MLDTGASHHITTHLQNFSLHSEYKGPNDVILGDGFGLLLHMLGPPNSHHLRTHFL